MTFKRRIGIVLALGLVLGMPLSLAQAGDVGPQLVPTAQEEARTPGEICDAATADLVEPETREFEQAEDVLKEGVDYAAVICTAQGPVYLDLFEDLAPATVNNFVFLAQQGFYNATTFHRVLPGFMAQGGDPTGTGSGGPGYTFKDETDNGLAFDTYGLLAMANAGPDTNGSQFFITYGPAEWLTGSHTIFGEVIAGIESVELLTPRDPQQRPTYEGDALNTIVIVEDKATVNAEPDGPPSVAHFQALLDGAVLGLEQIFTPVEDGFGPLDAAQTAALAAGPAGDDAASAMQDDLEARSFEGAATVTFRLDECLEDPEALPIWYLSYQVLDLGTADAAQAVVSDDERAEALVEAGLYESQSVSEDSGGRLFSRAAEDLCGPTGVFYRLELPNGRYLAVVEMVLDNRVVGEGTDISAGQFMDVVAGDLAGAMAGVFERGNAAE